MQVAPMFVKPVEHGGLYISENYRLETTAQIPILCIRNNSREEVRAILFLVTDGKRLFECSLRVARESVNRRNKRSRTLVSFVT